MNIFFNQNTKTFTLNTQNTQYRMAVVSDGYLAHLWYGGKLPDEDLIYLLRFDESPFTPETNNRERGSFMDNLPFEYPCFGIGDYRESAIAVLDSEGMSACDLRYSSHKIYSGKPALEGLPATFDNGGDCTTLEIEMLDSHLNLKATLIYSVFENSDIIARSVRFKNIGNEPFYLKRAYSACLELDSSQYDMITLNGSWARERMVQRQPLHIGKQSIESLRGESSHQNNPFMAVCSHNADEDNGEVYGLCFVYSGNFTAMAEVDQNDKTRLLMGINGFDFSWKLETGENFQAPEVLLTYTNKGIGQMSRNFHDVMRSNLIRGKYKDKTRPVLINNWEATYFKFDTDKLLSIADEASKLGIEMLVMDDGWFGHRDSDNSSLGDWFVYEEKLKGGLKHLVEQVNKRGMKFGIWFEPEMISPDSELFKAHPDWAIQVKGRPLTQSREQYVLDFSRKEVRDYIYFMMREILDSANIEYIKWDMNRQLTEVGSATLPADRQRELWHRYVLGVYDLMNRLTTDYPDILLENCSGGGARFDAGMLYYSPQIWCSDDTDAIERLKIQAGTSYVYPCSAMGAHVSDCPNHTVGRNTPFKTRGDVAMVGTFGYELDVTRISEEDKKQIPQQIEQFKKYNSLVRTGDFYRIGNMFEDNTWDAWEFVAKDKSEVLFEFVQVLARPNMRSRRIKLKGLDPNAYYFCEDNPEQVFSGKALMQCGINVAKIWGADEIWGDFASKVIHFIKA